MSHGRPNVVLIVLDATRPDRLGCYGYERETSPNIDRFSVDATIYGHCWSPAIWTLPAMVSIFTGLYPVEHGINSGRAQLPHAEYTLTNRLKRLGYQTAAFVATPWTSVGSSLRFDVHEVVGSLFEVTDPKWWHVGFQKAYQWLVSRDNKGAQQIRTRALEWLSTQQASTSPFFLYLHYMEPHAPYRAPRRYLDRFVTHEPADGVPLRKLAKAELPYLARRVELSRQQLATIGEIYDASIRFMDDTVGDLLSGLAGMDLLDETLIIVTADHGENLGEHGLLGHQYCLYDTLLQVPLIIRYPGGHASGHRVDSMVQSLDIMTTVADLLGVQEDWRSMASRWRSLVPESINRTPRSERAYAQYLHPLLERFQRVYPAFDCSLYDRRLWSIRTGVHKLIVDDRGNAELYNHREDPGETVNLADTHPNLVETLERELKVWLAQRKAFAAEYEEEEFAPFVADRLRGLGYL